MAVNELIMVEEVEEGCKPDTPNTPAVTASTSAAATTSSATNDGGDEDQQHPWPYFKELFLYIGVKASSFRMKCRLCLPKNSEILAFNNSPSNLKKHIAENYE